MKQEHKVTVTRTGKKSGLPWVAECICQHVPLAEGVTREAVQGFVESHLMRANWKGEGEGPYISL